MCNFLSCLLKTAVAFLEPQGLSNMHRVVFWILPSFMKVVPIQCLTWLPHWTENIKCIYMRKANPACQEGLPHSSLGLTGLAYTETATIIYLISLSSSANNVSYSSKFSNNMCCRDLSKDLLNISDIPVYIGMRHGTCKNWGKGDSLVILKSDCLRETPKSLRKNNK